MRIALIQFDPVVGDLNGNTARASKQVRAVHAKGAQLAVLPELALCGYPPRDLLLREGLAQACLKSAQDLAKAAPDCAVLVGLPRAAEGHERPLHNSVALLRGGRVEAFYDKRLLPTYDVFDEARYFAPGAGPGPLLFEHAGKRVAVLVCEDIWRAHDVNARATYSHDPVTQAADARPDVLVVPSASPFERGKHQRHVQILRQVAAQVRAPVVSVNQLGAFDDLVFDGDARVVWPGAECRAAARWGADGALVDLAAGGETRDAAVDMMADLWSALVFGTRGYLARTGHARAVLGISGGIDSALVGALAVAAVGAHNVTGVMMPSRWSSEGSVTDALELAQRTGMRTVTLPIEEAHALLAASIGTTLRTASGSGAEDLTPLADENLQSRLRGLQIMAVSNSTGALVLTTGNKSEYAAGYTTLYGDMNGGLAPIGDVLKTDVWALARWLNANHAQAGFAQPPIPEASISKVPSAELRPNQTDQDTLPPYEQLDAIIRAWVEEEDSLEGVVARTGLPQDLVHRWTQAIDRAEFKRYQATLILKVSSRAFGRGRRMPLAQQWRPS